MSRITNTFKTLKEKNKKALIPYITAGDPHPDLTVSMMHALVDSGADMIELGIPFSVVEGGHMFPLEHPVETVEKIRSLIDF